MKLKLILVIILIASIVQGILNSERPIKATVRLENGSFYRLTDYRIDEKKCLVFYDGLGVLNTYCRKYWIKPIEEYQKEIISKRYIF